MKIQTPVGTAEWENQPDGISAKGVVSKTAEYFQDHFPGFPVLPGVLAIELLRQIAEDHLNTQDGDVRDRWRISRLQGVRFSVYVRPGETWEARLHCIEKKKDQTHWKTALSICGRTAVQARIVLDRVPVLQDTLTQ